MNPIKLENRMDTIFMNSRNSKTSGPNLSDKIDLKRSDKYVQKSLKFSKCVLCLISGHLAKN